VMRVRRRDAGHRGAGPDRGVPVRQPRATQRAREAVQNLGLGPRHAACWRPGRLGQHHLGARRHRRDAQAKRDVRVRRWVPPPSPGIFPGSCAACEAILQMLQQMRTRRARQGGAIPIPCLFQQPLPRSHARAQGHLWLVAAQPREHAHACARECRSWEARRYRTALWEETPDVAAPINSGLNSDGSVSMSSSDQTHSNHSWTAGDGAGPPSCSEC
jgi:hypothetical protein